MNTLAAIRDPFGASSEPMAPPKTLKGLELHVMSLLRGLLEISSDAVAYLA